MTGHHKYAELGHTLAQHVLLSCTTVGLAATLRFSNAAAFVLPDSMSCAPSFRQVDQIPEHRPAGSPSIDWGREVGVEVTPSWPRRCVAGILMNLAHVHIVLNHVPSLGSIAGLLLLVAGIYKKDEALKQFAYGVLVLISMAVLPTYISGAEAQRIVEKAPSYSAGMVQLHQNAAMITLLSMT